MGVKEFWIIKWGLIKFRFLMGLVGSCLVTVRKVSSRVEHSLHGFRQDFGILDAYQSWFSSELRILGCEAWFFQIIYENYYLLQGFVIKCALKKNRKQASKQYVHHMIYKAHQQVEQNEHQLKESDGRRFDPPSSFHTFFSIHHMNT